MNNQRVGSLSNAHAGKEFEEKGKKALEAELGYTLESPLILPIGFDGNKKDHKFDFGSHEKKVIIECKSHRWTKSDNIPSAKLTVWREALLYFHLADNSFQKILLVLKDVRLKDSESLATYFVRLNKHLLPHNVEIWEYCFETENIQIIYTAKHT